MTRRPQEIHIDRVGRNQVSAMLAHWLDGQINAGQVVSQVTQIYKAQSKLPDGKRDVTLIDMTNELLFELEDEKPILLCTPTREAWNYIQRCRLLLLSDATLIDKTLRQWHWSCLPAAAALACYIAIVLWILWQDPAMFGLAIPLALIFGVIAWPIWWWHSRALERWAGKPAESCEPFASKEQIMEVRRQVTQFRNRPFVEERTNKNLPWLFRISQGTGHYVSTISGISFMTLFSPLLLLIAALPLSNRTVTLVWPNDEHGDESS